MLLHNVGIRNFRSLEEVDIQGLERFAVLIGRNNAGKSSIFGAIQALARVITGQAFDASTAITDNQPRELQVILEFALTAQERDSTFDLLFQHQAWEQVKNELKNTAL